MNITSLVIGLVVGASAALGASLWWLDRMDIGAAATIIGSGLGAGLSVWGAIAAVAHEKRLESEGFGALAKEAGTALKDSAFEFLDALDEMGRFPRLPQRLEHKLDHFVMYPENELYVQRLFVRRIDDLKGAMHVFSEQIARTSLGNVKLRMAVVRFRGVIARSEGMLDGVLAVYRPRQRMTEQEFARMEGVGILLVEHAQQFLFSLTGSENFAKLRRRYGQAPEEAPDAGPRKNSGSSPLRRGVE